MKSALPALALLLVGTAIASSGAINAADDFVHDGVVQPSRVIRLGAAADGLLTEVHARRGDVVRTGQVVARLDVSVALVNAQLARARAQATSSRDMVVARLEDAERRLAYQETLLKDGFITPEEVTATRTEVRIEKINLAQQSEDQAISGFERERAEALLAQAMVVSPIDGVVVDRYLSPGEIFTKVGDGAVMTIAQLDPLYVELHVPVDLFEVLAVGQSATVKLDVPGSPQRKAKILVKDHIVDTASRTFRVRLEIANPDNRLPAGLRCRVSFDK